MNLRNWKIDAGRKNAHDKFRMLSLLEYQAELPSPGVVSPLSLAAQALREAARIEGEAENVVWQAAAKRAREKREDEDASHAHFQKLMTFWDVRMRLGDDINGTFLPAREGPWFTPGHRWQDGPWWCSGEEAELPDWHAVLHARGLAREEEHMRQLDFEMNLAREAPDGDSSDDDEDAPRA